MNSALWRPSQEPVPPLSWPLSYLYSKTIPTPPVGSARTRRARRFHANATAPPGSLARVSIALANCKRQQPGPLRLPELKPRPDATLLAPRAWKPPASCQKDPPVPVPVRPKKTTAYAAFFMDLEYLFSSSPRIPRHATPIPAQPCVLSAWPLRKIESSTLKILRVVVTVVHTSGSKLAIV